MAVVILPDWKRSEWFALILLTVMMTNAGFGVNIANAFTCAQYYFDYLVAFSFLSFGLYANKQWMTNWPHLIKGGISILGILILSWSYSRVTNCPFDWVLFATSEVPVLSIALGFYYWSESRMIDNDNKQIDLQTITSRLFVEESKICFVEIKNGVAILDVEGEKHLLSGTLSSLESMLSDRQFYKANRQFLINRDFIKSLKPVRNKGLEVGLKDGASVMVNKNRVSHFKAWWSNKSV